MPQQELRGCPKERWEALGNLLVRRRVNLDRGYTKRAVFARDRNINYRLVFDIERAKRQDFGAAVIILIEVAYRLQIGTIRQYLTTGETGALGSTDDKPKAAAA